MDCTHREKGLKSEGYYRGYTDTEPSYRKITDKMWEILYRSRGLRIKHGETIYETDGLAYMTPKGALFYFKGGRKGWIAKQLCKWYGFKCYQIELPPWATILWE